MNTRKNVELELTPEELRKLQLVQLDMLIEVDRVCRENRIEYSLAGGTLLGAVRHKGFIPWDDDLDIVLLRPEYKKFSELFDEATDSTKYYFQDADNTQGYRWGYGKIRRKNTLWLRSGQEHLPFKQEICIDVIPLDRVPNHPVASKIHNFHCFIIRKITWSEVGKYIDKNPLIRTIYGLLSKIPMSSVWKHYHKFAKKNNKDCNHGLRVLLFPTPRGYDYEGKTDWYDEYTELVFEGRMFKVMAKYKDYLRLKYNDYMTLPPESERLSNPASEFQLPPEE
jgi:lipopolysaccharide cholinephosphotransferase